MNLQQKPKIESHFSRAAASYDAHAIVQKEMAKDLIHLLPPARKDFCQIVEIGCGTGLLTSELAEHFPKAAIFATDISKAMLAQAEAKLSNLPQIKYLQLDGEKLLPPECLPVDLIASSAVFQWFSNPQRAFANFAMSLKEGGYLAFSTFGPQTFKELSASFQAAYRQAKRAPFCVHGPQFLSKDELEDLLEGFSCEISSQIKEQYFPTVKDFLRSLKKVGAQNASAGKDTLKSRLIVQNMLENYEKNYRTKKGIRATYEVIYCLAHKKSAF